jgi:hypothetical protein
VLLSLGHCFALAYPPLKSSKQLSNTSNSLVCPNCSNALTISRAEPTAGYPMGVNKFECRTCPYQYILDSTYYERSDMKRKEVEDVLGGKDEWKNADSMAGKFQRVLVMLSTSL